MTLDEAREEIISGIDYAASRETDSSLHDSDETSCSVGPAKGDDQLLSLRRFFHSRLLLCVVACA